MRIPQFDQSDRTHLKIAELSRLAHSLARMNKEAELKNIEQEIDDLSCKIYNLQTSMLPIIQELLKQIHS